LYEVDPAPSDTDDTMKLLLILATCYAQTTEVGSPTGLSRRPSYRSVEELVAMQKTLKLDLAEENDELQGEEISEFGHLDEEAPCAPREELPRKLYSARAKPPERQDKYKRNGRKKWVPERMRYRNEAGNGKFDAELDAKIILEDPREHAIPNWANTRVLDRLFPEAYDIVGVKIVERQGKFSLVLRLSNEFTKATFKTRGEDEAALAERVEYPLYEMDTRNGADLLLAKPPKRESDGKFTESLRLNVATPWYKTNKDGEESAWPICLLSIIVESPNEGPNKKSTAEQTLSQLLHTLTEISGRPLSAA